MDGLPPPELSINSDAFDRWSLVHTGSGFTLGALGVPWWMALGVSTVYEFVEYAHEWPDGSFFFGSKRPESAANILGDMTLLMAAYFVGRAVAEESGKPALVAATAGTATLLTAFDLLPQHFSFLPGLDQEPEPDPET